MISNGKDRLLTANPGTLPDMTDALMDWFQNLVFTTVTKTVVNFKLVETVVANSYQGVVQPFTPEQLQMKPMAQQQWKWSTVHATPDLIMKNDDEFIYLGLEYRVVSKTDYKEYGYVLYEIVETIP